MWPWRAGLLWGYTPVVFHTVKNPIANKGRLKKEPAPASILRLLPYTPLAIPLLLVTIPCDHPT